jgi:ornithine decarboxylase
VCIVDLGAVARLFRDWSAAMPRVVPFYAVKANNDEAMLAMLAALGAGFDCASEAEVCAAPQLVFCQ